MSKKKASDKLESNQEPGTPATHDSPPHLDDLGDRQTLQRLQDVFTRATGLDSLIVDKEGRPWTTPSGPMDACHATGLGPSTPPCMDKHRQLGMEARSTGASSIRWCDRCSMHHAGIPILVGDWHLGTWLCGPVRTSEQPDSKEESRDGTKNEPKHMPMDQFERAVTLLDEFVRALCVQGHRLTESHAVILSRRRRERHLDDILNALADPVFVKDEQHRWVTLNSAYCTFMGFPRELLLGKSDFDFFPLEEAREFWRKDDETFRTDKTTLNEERFTDASGKTHFISTKKKVFTGESGKKYLVGIIRDITNRRKVEEELSRHRDHLEDLVTERTMELSSANRLLQREVDERRRAEAEKREMQAQLVHQQKLEAIGRLAGGVAHDFNNLLTGIFGHVTLALREDNLSERAEDSLLQVREAARRAADLTKQLLAFSRKQIIEPRIVNLNDLIDNLRRLLGRIIGEDVQLITQYDKHLCAVRVDPVQIEQVVVNLAVNARDAMPGGGVLRLETMNREVRDLGFRSQDSPAPGTYAVLVVSDTGVGMDEQTQAQIFEPFFTTKPKGQGTGLGLAMVYGIVKQHRGTTLVDSEPGRGSIFQILLPCADIVGQKTSEPPEEEGIIGGSETILLVEDEEVVRLATQGMLQQLGYQVIPAHNGAAAIKVSESFRGTIHLLMTDVVMPLMNGRELAETLGHIRPDMQVLFTSGYTDDVIVHHGVLDANVHFISKPFDTAELAKRVRKAIDG